MKFPSNRNERPHNHKVGEARSGTIHFPKAPLTEPGMENNGGATYSQQCLDFLSRVQATKNCNTIVVEGCHLNNTATRIHLELEDYLISEGYKILEHF